CSAAWGSCLRGAEASQCPPAVGPWMTHSSAPIGNPGGVQPWLELSPCPAVHSDFAALAALAAAHEDRAAGAGGCQGRLPSVCVARQPAARSATPKEDPAPTSSTDRPGSWIPRSARPRRLLRA